MRPGPPPAVLRALYALPEQEPARTVAALLWIRKVWGPPRPPPGEAEQRMGSILERARARAQGALR